MKQREITEKIRLLNEKGNIEYPGYAKKLLWEYNRENVTASKLRLKEWDYYYIGDRDKALCLTVADLGFVGSNSISVLEFGSEPWQVTQTAIDLLPLGKYNMPRTSEVGDISVAVGATKITITNDGTTRHMYGQYPKFGNNGEDLTFDVTVTGVPEESMVIATPFTKDKHFYYNQKINCMLADGTFTLGDKTYEFKSSEGAMCTLDWGRGVWTYDNTWYWGSLQTSLDDGSTFGWNIGYGFGCNEEASENMLFYNGKSHKLDEITFNIPVKDGVEDYMAPWTFTSNDGRFFMDFTPIIDRNPPFDLKLIAMLPHQVFGLFTGYAILDDGTKITIENKLGFAEKVHNKW